MTQQLDNNSYYSDLTLMVGKEFSDNGSSTLRSKLISISGKTLKCKVQEVPSPYYGEVKNPKPKTYSLSQVHRCFFGV